ncbi:uncharacterized protein LOC111865327 [Cryptotermes secundus]|uniref:uncharacterized protein LOC111865327 n=1 Tax=Cryptotermes secundus TaxID=105785 RepID=UPI000CD7B21C|nr:uncharacterized protein LOC111865327 [Cryptotermes secundus]
MGISYWVCFACLIVACSADGAPTTEEDIQELSQGHWEKRSIGKHKKDKHGHRQEEEEIKDEVDYHEGHKFKKSKDKKHQKPILVEVEDSEPFSEEHIESYSVPIPVPVDRPYPVEVKVPEPQPYPVYIREPYPVYVVKVTKSRPQSVYVPVKVRTKYEYVSRPYFN